MFGFCVCVCVACHHTSILKKKEVLFFDCENSELKYIDYSLNIRSINHVPALALKRSRQHYPNSPVIDPSDAVCT